MSTKEAHAPAKSLLEALLAAQVKFPEIPKDRENTYFHSWYSTLDAIISTCRPILNAEGLLLDHFQEKVESQWYMVARLTLAATGEERTNRYPLAVDFETLSPQARGSEITYGRRYSLAPLLGITSDEDDDGNAASQERKPQRSEGGQSRGKRQQRSEGNGEQKPPKGGPPSGEKKPADPLVAWQKVFVSAKNPQEFYKRVEQLHGNDLLDIDRAAYEKAYTFAARNLESRVQRGEFNRDDPDVDTLYGALNRIGERLTAAATGQAESDIHLDQKGIFDG